MHTNTARMVEHTVLTPCDSQLFSAAAYRTTSKLTNLPRDARSHSEVLQNVLVSRRHLRDEGHRIRIGLIILHLENITISGADNFSERPRRYRLHIAGSFIPRVCS